MSTNQLVVLSRIVDLSASATTSTLYKTEHTKKSAPLQLKLPWLATTSQKVFLNSQSEWLTLNRIPLHAILRRQRPKLRVENGLVLAVLQQGLVRAGAEVGFARRDKDIVQACRLAR